MFDGVSWCTYKTNGLLDNNITCIASENNDNLWVGTSKGVSKFDGLTWTNYTTENGLVNNIIYTIEIDSIGNKWFGTTEGISFYNGLKWINYKATDSLPLHNVSCIKIDRFINLWIGTSNGVFKFDRINWINYTLKNGLVSNKISCITIDPSEIHWIGTYEHGISRFDSFNERAINFRNNRINKYISSSTTDSKGNKWIVGNCGVIKIHRNKCKIYSSAGNIRFNFISHVKIDKQDNIWISKGNEVYKFCKNPTKNSLVKVLENENEINGIAFGLNNKIYLATSYGLIFLNN
jgi:ligand-binding sensor domain-containing protein